MVEGRASNSSSGNPAFFRASAARSSAAKSSASDEAPSEESSPASVGRKASAAGRVADCYPIFQDKLTKTSRLIEQPYGMEM